MNEIINQPCPNNCAKDLITCNCPWKEEIINVAEALHHRYQIDTIDNDINAPIPSELGFKLGRAFLEYLKENKSSVELDRYFTSHNSNKETGKYFYDVTRRIAERDKLKGKND